MNYGVLTHIYNEEKTVKRVLESIINQKQKPSYILVVDDGSTDNTPEIVNSFNVEYHPVSPDREKPAYIRRAEAFNKGLTIIKEKQHPSKCVLKIDGDIIIEKHYASELIRHFYEPHTAAVSGVSTKYSKTRNLNNGAVMYRLNTLPYARTMSGWDLDIELHLIENGFNCIVDPTVKYTDLRPPNKLKPSLSKVIQNRVKRKIAEQRGKHRK